jgi:hypothetical protein
MAKRWIGWTVFALITLGAGGGGRAKAQERTAPDEPEPPLPSYLKDRGTGVATSMFGTYIRRGELIIYPFFEYDRSDSFEYKPEEFGFEGNVDYFGRYRGSEWLVFLGYGLTEDLAVELEAAAIDASFEKSSADPSDLPARIEESGVGDVQAQLRWRWRREDESRPELFSFFEVVFPHSQDKLLIGTPGWELKFGTGLTRGFHWGTMTARVSIEYSEASTSPWDLGEYAIEYLKRVSPAWRFYVGLEGESDELVFIGEAQWHLSRHIFIKLNNGFGLTKKATDWAPEVGVVFTLPTR